MSFVHSFRLSVGLVAIAAGSAYGQERPADPLWWSSGEPPVISLERDVNNFGPANIGQAKWVAFSALEALRQAGMVLTANAIERDLVGLGRPIVSWDIGGGDSQYAPLLVGQLKAIAQPFYVHLSAYDSAGIFGQLDQNLTRNPGDQTSIFPWASTIAPAGGNRKLATIGQLKAVFALRLREFKAVDPNDVDRDGLNDEWELANGFDPTDPDEDNNGILDSLDDRDGDLISNLEEFRGDFDPSDPTEPETILTPGVILPIPAEGSILVSVSDLDLNDDQWSIFYQIDGGNKRHLVSNRDPKRVARALLEVPVSVPVRFTIQRAQGFQQVFTDEYRVSFVVDPGQGRPLRLVGAPTNAPTSDILRYVDNNPPATLDLSWTYTLEPTGLFSGAINNAVLSGQNVAQSDIYRTDYAPDTTFIWTPPAETRRFDNHGPEISRP